MAKKRRAETVEPSDTNSYSESSTSSKRARIEDEDAVPQKKRVNNPKGKGKMGKGKMDASRESDDEGECTAPHITTEQDDDEFEATQGERIRKDIEAGNQRTGNVAQIGVIEAIDMTNFMCHPRLSFKFGPQVNFIIGRNGSGKSAVLSALTVALGGKAISTGRGNGLKSFIRQGQNYGEVSVTIKNLGEEAYLPDVYGESIIITRRFTKEGGSSYKIQSAERKTISNKRDELSAICDHMNIQVDNPMNVLTQDLARQFLAGSSSQEKYQFFLKGTQLTQLQEEYETCLENIGKTTRTLQLKREEIPDLEKAFREADARNKEAVKAREKQSQLAEYKRELAWAHVKNKEYELGEKLNGVETAKKRIPKIKQKIEETQADLDETTANVNELEAEKNAVPSIDSIKNDLKEVREAISRNKEEIRDCKSSEREMNQSINSLGLQIQSLEVEIKKRTEEQGDVQAERERVQRELERLTAERNVVDEQLQETANQPNLLGKSLTQVQSEIQDVSRKIKEVRDEIEAAIGNIEQCKNKDRNELNIFGQRLDQVIARVRQEKWIGEIPVGPFGLYVANKDPKWANVMRAQLGSLMSSWAVTDNRDRLKLKQLLESMGNPGVSIVVSDVDLFDYSSGEPDERIYTVLRALEIKQEFIKRILINQRSIEKVLLVDDRGSAQKLLEQLGGAGVAWTADGFIVRVYAEGGSQSTPLDWIKAANDPRQHMFSSSDRTADIQRWELSKLEAETRLNGLQSREPELRQRLKKVQEDIQITRKQEQTLRNSTNQLRKEIERLNQEALIDAPVNVDFFEQSKATLVEEKESLMAQFKVTCKRRMDLDGANAPLLENRDELDRRVENWESGMQEIRKRYTAALEKRVEANKQKKYWEDKLLTEEAQIEELQRVADIVQKEFEEWSEKAEQSFGERVEKPRKPNVIERQIESVQRALAQHEKQQGASPEEIAVERDNAEIALLTHKRQIKEIHELNKALKKSLELRMAKWVSFRQHIALRCKYQFQHHLWSRGYYGKVMFDHNAGTLHLRVQTEDQAATQAADKDPKVLSGGEKSYSTICLLLALWESIQCPIRCLDEFDVFMDSVNRRISMKMMIDTANASDKQYILITPQDMSNVNIALPTIRVHRMHDPERGQISLN